MIIASFFDQPAAVEMLLAAGADRATKTNAGKTAKDVAASEAYRLSFERRLPASLACCTKAGTEMRNDWAM